LPISEEPAVCGNRFSSGSMGYQPWEVEQHRHRMPKIHAIDFFMNRTISQFDGLEKMLLPVMKPCRQWNGAWRKKPKIKSILILKKIILLLVLKDCFFVVI
jgi:hypothetical protein